MVVNRVMRWVLSSPWWSRGVGGRLLLLHVSGRRTGRLIDIPVTYSVVGERLLVLTTSGWRVNLRGRPEVEVTVRGRRGPARAELMEDPDSVARVYHDRIAELGYASAGRRMGIRISVDRTPTLEELAEAARRDHLSVIYLTVAEEGL